MEEDESLVGSTAFKAVVGYLEVSEVGSIPTPSAISKA